MAPAEPGSGAASNEEEEEEGESTSLDLPGRPQAIAELDTLQRYLLGVSHSDKAQIACCPSNSSSKKRCTTQLTIFNSI